MKNSEPEHPDRDYESPRPLAEIRKRFLQAGSEALSDHELLALVIGSGRRVSFSDNPIGLAAKILDQAGGLYRLARRDITELCRLPGLGKARACTLLAAAELGRRVAVPAPSSDKSISCAADVAEWFRCRLQDNVRECIYALLLDSKHRPLKNLRITEGSWTSCPVDPKVIFSACLRHQAPAVILVHNHPSGDPTPSRDDLKLTERLVRAGSVVGVRVLDHLIVGREGFHSMADAGLL